MFRFFNTIKQTGEELSESQEKAKRQEIAILNYFLKNKGKSYTPFQVQENLHLVEVPITSIRRAMTNLTNKGKLVKTDRMIPERFGKPNFLWTYKEEV